MIILDLRSHISKGLEIFSSGLTDGIDQVGWGLRMTDRVGPVYGIPDLAFSGPWTYLLATPS